LEKSIISIILLFENCQKTPNITPKKLRISSLFYCLFPKKQENHDYFQTPLVSMASLSLLGLVLPRNTLFQLASPILFVMNSL
jgi:hypothetical protein